MTARHVDPIELLDFVQEHALWDSVSSLKVEREIRERWDFSGAVFWMKVLQSIQLDAMAQARPEIVARLRRLRDQRRAARTVATTTPEVLDRVIPRQQALELPRTDPPPAPEPEPQGSSYANQEDLLSKVGVVDRVIQQRARDAAYRNEDPDWLSRAWEALQRLAATGQPFTADELHELAGDPTNYQSVGPLFGKAARDGLIRKTGRHPNGKRPALRGTVLTEWIGAAAAAVQEATG